MPDKPNPFLKRARKWAKENNLSGSQAFLRYVIFNFVESINAVSIDFVFKGGNLLWLYIKTPRATVDLDFSTLRIRTHRATANTRARRVRRARNATLPVTPWSRAPCLLSRRATSRARRRHRPDLPRM